MQQMDGGTVLVDSSTSWRLPHIAEKLLARQMRWDGVCGPKMARLLCVERKDLVFGAREKAAPSRESRPPRRKTPY